METKWKSIDLCILKVYLDYGMNSIPFKIVKKYDANCDHTAIYW